MPNSSKAKALFRLTQERIALLLAPTLGLISLVLSSLTESIQTIVSSNQTIQTIQEVTKMPAWFIFYILLPLAIAVYGYLWVKAGKMRILLKSAACSE